MHKNRLFGLALLASLAFHHNGLFAEASSDIEAMSGSRELALDKAFRQIIDRHKINTAGVAVIKSGQIAWQNQFGQQSVGTPASSETLFNIGSITKTVTAETILRLVADGRLSLDEPMSGYWVDPDLTDDPNQHKLTARMALTHTTGFANWRFLTAEKTLTFVNEPGERFGYSGEGFEYVARYAERKLGLPFEQLVQSQVFQPLGMKDVSFSVREACFPRIARPLDESGKFLGHYCWPGGWCRSEGDYSAAGSMVVSVADYAKFMISSMHGDRLGAALNRDKVAIQGFDTPIECEKNPDLLCPRQVGYGLGWNITELENDKLIGHRGSDWSVVSVAYYYQGSGDGLVIFFNAPNRAGISAMVDALELLDPDSPELHGYRSRRERAKSQ